MKKFRRVGDAVDVPALGISVERGAEVEVSDPFVVASFEAQTEVWELVSPKRSAAVTAPAEEG